ncbi:MAG: molybdate ABC transporter substrate-binding protein [Clostridiales Family XIII bacterium]|nr:molybdate ABC transporter substrate-binding protein [Clostridiales Family XIII bacterium]
MKKQKLFAIVLTLIMAAALLAGCGSKEAPAPEPPAADGASQEAPAPEPEPEPGLTGAFMIAAAASLQNALDGDLIPLFNQANPDVAITGTYDSSGKLQTQIEEGLDAQIFFSAATKQMTALAEGGFIDSSSVVNLLENEVVLITGTDTETKVTGFENITDAEGIAIGDPASVPAGQYAQEILTSLGSWDAVNAKASLGTNVTEVLTWVAEGSAEVGVVYRTDAASMADKVKVIASAPEGSLQTPVVYPVGLSSDLGDKAEAARAFIEFLRSPEALAVFEKYGFKPL